MNLSIVVPIYRGETFIEPLVADLEKKLPLFAEKYEIILVNDGSPDQSWDVIQRAARGNNNVKGIRLMRNYGQHNATKPNSTGSGSTGANHTWWSKLKIMASASMWKP